MSNSTKTRLAIAFFSFGFVLMIAAFIVGKGRPYEALPYGPGMLNHFLLSVASEYPTGDRGVLVPSDRVNTSYGVSEDIYYQGRRAAKRDPEGKVYCVGLMFEIYMKACAKAGGRDFQLGAITENEIGQFRKDWYGVDGNRRTLVRTLSERGLGIEITNPEEAREGDLVQFWRKNGSGHSVLFLGWERDSTGDRRAISYWSAQSANGISENTEYFANHGGDVLNDEIYIVRAYKP